MHRRQRTLGFTLIELLVVIAIIALLVGILLPSLAAARETARDTKCRSNLSQLTVSLSLYSNDYKGQYPPCLDNAPDRDTGKFTMTWYDETRIGNYLPQMDGSNILPSNTRNNTVGGGGMICPSHPDGGRSYTINFWASSAGSWRVVNGRVESFKPGASPIDLSQAGRGKAFDQTVDQSTKTMLLSEAWGLFPSESGPRTWFTIGQVGIDGRPGQRFGGGTGIFGSSFPGSWAGQALEMGPTNNPSALKSYIPWYRHPRNRTEPLGLKSGANMSFVDGHVDQFKYSDVVAANGASTLRVLWSPLDPQINNP